MPDGGGVPGADPDLGTWPMAVPERGRIYDLRSTYATRLSAGGVADEWVTELLRQGDAKVFKKSRRSSFR
jgi:hypothetical protein